MEKSVDLVPALVTFLAAAHVIALVYWIYRLASDRKKMRQWSMVINVGTAELMCCIQRKI
ncbi:hypothetical protein F2Q70_00032381 [Brassica cretica]|uniref:Uncharacterized protein n=1 Tax=Brassica cretica TaxID=69181 RepID=A0A8S9FH94_BRACR|nr:hypothetical protein F2Q70_00032381 [Brassica cretica]